MFGLVAQESQNVHLGQEGSQELSGVAGTAGKVNVPPSPPGWMKAIPRRLTVAFAFVGMGLLATMPSLLKIPSVNATFFASVRSLCFAAGFLIYTTAVIRDLREHGVF